MKIMERKGAGRALVIAVSILLFLSLISIAHATSGKYLYSLQSNITLTESSSPVQSSVGLFSNSTLSVSASTNSSHIMLSKPNFNVTTSGYNFTFDVNNASSPAEYWLTFSAKVSSNHTATFSIPVYIQAPTQNVSVSGYRINLFGNVQSNSQVVVYVTQNGATVTSGNLFIQYNNVSQHYSLSTINSYATVDFPQLYGNVIFEYVAPDGQLVGPLIVQVANSSSLPNAQRQVLTAYCNGKQTNIQTSNSTSIVTYQISPFQNISCLLYNQNTASFVSGVSVQLVSNGAISRPYPTNSLGEVVIPYPQGGWPIGVMAIRPAASKLYSIGSAYFEVVPLPNPLTYSVNADNLIVNPVVPQTITITYPNGTVFTNSTNSSFKLTAIGNIKLEAVNPSYSTFSATITLSPIDLDFVIVNNGEVQSTGIIHPYITYTFELLQGSSVYDYNGNLAVGGTILSFSNGVAHGYLTSYNLSFVPYSNEYSVSTNLVALPTSFYIALPSTISEGESYTFSMVPENYTLGNTTPIIHYTGEIYVTQNNKTTPIHVSDSIGTISFASSGPATFFFNSTPSLILAHQEVFVKNTSYGDITYIGVGAGVFLLVIVTAVIFRRGRRSTVFVGE
ncbi:MAG: hypothetical protein QW478_04980 [Candidatus Micrarchaeaceae archaeon]